MEKCIESRRRRDGRGVDEGLVAGSLVLHPEIGDWLLIWQVATLVEDPYVVRLETLGGGRVASPRLNLPPKVGEAERLSGRGEDDRGRLDACRAVAGRDVVLVNRRRAVIKAFQTVR